MRELVVRKDQLVAQRATPPFYLKVCRCLHASSAIGAQCRDREFLMTTIMVAPELL